MVNGGRPPLPPRQRRSRPSRTPDTGEGGPKLPIPAIQVEADLGRRWFLQRTESRSTARSSFRLFRSTATPTTPTPTLGTPRYAGGRGGVPRGETVKRTAGV